MTQSEIIISVDKLRYLLIKAEDITRGMSKDWFEKDCYISAMRLANVQMRIEDLIVALDNMGEVDKRIIGGLKL